MKVAVVTGSTKGIGKAIGMKLLQEGYFVYFNYANDDEGKKLLDSELTKYTEHYAVIKTDFHNENQLDLFVDTVIQRHGKLDVLVLNAGITNRTPWNQLGMEAWNDVLYTNLTVPAFLTQKFGQYISEGGSVLFIGSILGMHAHSLSVPYGVSKAGMHFLAKSLVKEYADKDVTVNAICTGFADTDWQKKKTKEQRERIQNKIALKRFAEVDEIAGLAMEMIRNRYMTGSVVEISGGYASV